MFCFQGVKYKNILDVPELEIPEGQVTSIIGESGSGKTTLMRLLNKLISCSEGEIYYKGKALKEIDSVEHRRRVVMLSQEPAVFPGTVRENLLIGLKFSEKPLVGDEALYKAMETVYLKKDLVENVEKLSGGEKQRLCIARIILMEPEVLLLDEPTSALDETTEEIVIGKLLRYAKSHRSTVIMVTHSKTMAEKFSDIILHIEKGRLISKRRLFD